MKADFEEWLKSNGVPKDMENMAELINIFAEDFSKQEAEELGYLEYYKKCKELDEAFNDNNQKHQDK